MVVQAVHNISHGLPLPSQSPVLRTALFWHNRLELQLLAMDHGQTQGFRERTALTPALTFVESKTIDITFVLKKHNWVIKRVASCGVIVLVQLWPQHGVHFCVHATLFLCLHQIVITAKKIACN